MMNFLLSALALLVLCCCQERTTISLTPIIQDATGNVIADAILAEVLFVGKDDTYPVYYDETGSPALWGNGGLSWEFVVGNSLTLPEEPIQIECSVILSGHTTKLGSDECVASLDDSGNLLLIVSPQEENLCSIE